MVEYAPTCNSCREIFSARKPPEEPPCGECQVVPEPENEKALRIFFMVKDQYIMSSGGPVAHNQVPIYEALRMFKVENQERCLNQVVKLSGWWLQKRRDDAGE